MEKVENFLTVRLLMQGKEVGSIIGKVLSIFFYFRFFSKYVSVN